MKEAGLLGSLDRFCAKAKNRRAQLIKSATRTRGAKTAIVTLAGTTADARIGVFSCLYARARARERSTLFDFRCEKPDREGLDGSQPRRKRLARYEAPNPVKPGQRARAREGPRSHRGQSALTWI